MDTNDDRRADIGRLVLRVTVGGLLLLHGVAKVQHGVGGIAGMLASHHLPGVIAYGSYLGEVVAPLMVLLGVFTRPAAAVMAFFMVVAVWLAHTAMLFHRGPQGGYALELQALYLFGAVAIALLGAGRFAVLRNRWS